MGLFGGFQNWASKTDPKSGMSFQDRALVANAIAGGDPLTAAKLKMGFADRAKAAGEATSNDEYLQRTGVPSQIRVLMKINPVEGAKALSDFLKPQIVGNESSVSAGGEFSRPDQVKQVGDSLVSIPGTETAQPDAVAGFTPASTIDLTGARRQEDAPPPRAKPQGVRSIFTAPPSFADQTARMVATKPVYQTVGDKQTLVRVPGVGKAPGATGAPQAAPSGAIFDQIASIAGAQGAGAPETGYLRRLAEVESSGSPAAQNGSSTGLFQFHPDTFQKVRPGGNIHDITDQTAAALALSRQDRSALQAMGVDPSDANAYIMHQQGGPGGKALLTAPPEMNAISVLSPVYGDPATARKAIVNNGGSVDMTAGQFTDMWRKRWAGQGGSTPASPSPTTSGAEVVFQGKPIDPTVADIDPSLAGDAVLKALPTKEVSIVKALADGRMQFPAGAALRSPYWQKMLQSVSQYDPTFDAINYNARSKTRNNFTSGQAAKNLTSLNTVIGHLGALDKSIDHLGNSKYPMLNTVANATQTHLGDTKKQVALKEFGAAKTAAVDELVKAFRGTGGSVHDIEEWEKQINDSSSPAQLHATVKQAVELLHSRIEAVGQEYDRGMGKSSDPINLLSPKARETLARLGGEAPKTTAPADMPRFAAPPQAAVQYLKANPGQRVAFDQKYGQGAASRALGR